MNKKWKKVWLVLCCMALFAGLTVSAAETKIPNDSAKDFAVVSEGKISAEQVKAGDVLKYQFRITETDLRSYRDFEDGVSEIAVTWQSEKQQKIEQVLAWKNKAASATFSGKIKIAKGMQKGKWRIARIELRSFGDDDDYEALNLYNSSLSQAASAVDLTFSEFVVNGTGKADKAAPKVNLKSMSLSKNHAKSGQKVKFSVKVSDKSAIKYVKCTWQSKKKGVGLLHTEDYMLKYNKKKGCYQITLSGDKKGYYAELAAIEVCDIYGNTSIYKNKQKKNKAAFAKMKIYGK